ncbi:MAG: lipopolysaccharide biosynthesis protein [Fusobacteriaceae bacterium]|nr:lipopolysaccharide biosynthesis protein [Fusobacteriaceae bacterium]
MDLKKCEYKGFDVFYFKKKELDLGKNIIDKKYIIDSILKESKRNYVAVVKINDVKYLLKEPRNEYRLIQRHIMSFFKKGEALTTLLNIRNHIANGLIEYGIPYTAIVKRKNGFIEYSAILFEYYVGKPVGEYPVGEDSVFYKNIVLEVCKKIHKLDIYHGDVNVWNFIIADNKIKILDTQGKKMLLGNYRAHYDMLNFKIENYHEMMYPYNKNIWYYFALSLKKFKKLKIIQKIKETRHIKRDGFNE